jgi:hypothetical protein
MVILELSPVPSTPIDNTPEFKLISTEFIVFVLFT